MHNDKEIFLCEAFVTFVTLWCDKNREELNMVVTKFFSRC